MKSLAVYQELGLLAASNQSIPFSPPQDGGHAYHPHHYLWDHCSPALARPFAGPDSPVVFSSPGPGLTVGQALERTRFLFFLGAALTPALRQALDAQDTACLVFEPDLDRLNAFCASMKPHLLKGKSVFFVGGDPDLLDVPLLSMLPEDLGNLGHPLPFALDGLPEALPEYVRRVEEMVELFYYRTIIYSLDSQENIRGFPLRPMRRDAIIDRYKHFYENLEPCLRAGVLSDLLGGLTGYTAILCAAGPALSESFDFIRTNRNRAAVIAVNSAVKPLLTAGITPHFVVINDTSMESEPTLAGLPEMTDTVLVAHCLSTSGNGGFPDMRFFGNFPGQPLPKRDSLLLHGSVITTAFSLAEYLGCVKVVLAGVQLSSPDPYWLNYAAGSQHERQISGITDITITHRWPELYPVTAADGSQAFTTLNFFDAAQWFADRIKQASLEVVNLCPTSILKGPGIVFDPSPVLPESPGLAGKLKALPRSDLSGKRERVLDFIRQEMTVWKQKQREAKQAGTSLKAAIDFVAASDLDNSSFMLQRFEDFDNARFHAAFFQGADLETRLWGAGYFLTAMEKMCGMLLGILIEQHKRIV